MTSNQAKALFIEISAALHDGCVDMAASLSSLGHLMCVEPSPELWQRIEGIGGFKLAV